MHPADTPFRIAGFKYTTGVLNESGVRWKQRVQVTQACETHGDGRRKRYSRPDVLIRRFQCRLSVHLGNTWIIRNH